MKLKFFLLLCLSTIIGTASTHRDYTASSDIFGGRLFVENKGQFDGATNTKDKIQYAYENGDERIYFTDKGLVYRLIKHFQLSEKEREAVERGAPFNPKPDEIYYVNMNWANSNSNIQIVETEKQSTSDPIIT